MHAVRQDLFYANNFILAPQRLRSGLHSGLARTETQKARQAPHSVDSQSSTWGIHIVISFALSRSAAQTFSALRIYSSDYEMLVLNIQPHKLAVGGKTDDSGLAKVPMKCSTR